MKIHRDLIKLVLLPFVVVSPIAVAQEFMSEEETLDTFSGATISSISVSGYSNTRWTQEYEEFKKRQTEGIIKGDAGGKSYESKWFIRNGKWCENWGTGNGCYNLVRVDEKSIRAYDKGVPLKNIWEIL